MAQYLGSGRPQRIGPAMWQGIYFSIGAGLLVAALSPLAGPAFDLAGHDPALRGYEVAYARALMLGAFPVILMATLSAFFAGRGQTQAILRVNVIATLVNVVLRLAPDLRQRRVPGDGGDRGRPGHDPLPGGREPRSTSRSS